MGVVKVDDFYFTTMASKLELFNGRSLGFAFYELEQ